MTVRAINLKAEAFCANLPFYPETPPAAPKWVWRRSHLPDKVVVYLTPDGRFAGSIGRTSRGSYTWMVSDRDGSGGQNDISDSLDDAMTMLSMTARARWYEQGWIDPTSVQNKVP